MSTNSEGRGFCAFRVFEACVVVVVVVVVAYISSSVESPSTSMAIVFKVPSFKCRDQPCKAKFLVDP